MRKIETKTMRRNIETKTRPLWMDSEPPLIKCPKCKHEFRNREQTKSGLYKCPRCGEEFAC